MLRAERRQVGGGNRLAIDFSAVAPDDFDEIQRERPVDVGGHGPLIASPCHAVVPDQNLARRHEEIAVAKRFQDRAVVVFRPRRPVDLQIVDREVRVEIVLGSFLVRIDVGDGVLGPEALARVHVVHRVNRVEAAPVAHADFRVVLTHARLERDAKVAIVLHVRLVPDQIGVSGGALRAWMRVIPVRALGIHHLLNVLGAAGVIHLAVSRHFLDERLSRLPHLAPVDIPGPDDVVVAAEERARLFPRHDQEVLVRRAPGRFEIILLIGEAQRAGVVRVKLEMEVAQTDHVQPQRLHRDQILEWRVERS